MLMAQSAVLALRIGDFVKADDQAQTAMAMALDARMEGALMLTSDRTGADTAALAVKRRHTYVLGRFDELPRPESQRG